jgi:integrase
LISDVESAFKTVAKKMGLPYGRGQRRPTPHSLRHAFAVRALQSCPDGRDRITQHMFRFKVAQIAGSHGRESA